MPYLCHTVLLPSLFATRNRSRVTCAVPLQFVQNLSRTMPGFPHAILPSTLPTHHNISCREQSGHCHTPAWSRAAASSRYLVPRPRSHIHGLVHGLNCNFPWQRWMYSSIRNSCSEEHRGAAPSRRRCCCGDWAATATATVPSHAIDPISL